MGLLRFLLAISVVIAHSGCLFGLTLVGGEVAVESFFMVSGFYMAMILTEKYTGKHSFYLFISNRILRLLPAYLFILVLSFFSGIVSLHLGALGGRLAFWQQYFSSMSFSLVVLLIATNLLLIGQDLTNFFNFETISGRIHLETGQLNHSVIGLQNFLFVPQAWSLSLELLFYLIVPFIMPKKLRWIVLVIFISFILRIFLYHIGFNRDPWSYRFFPLEIAYFLLGILCYRIYIFIKHNKKFNKNIQLFMFLLISFFTFSYQFLPGVFLKQYLYYLILFFTMPFVFLYTKNISLDRYLGELSYPIYVSHIFTMMLCSFFFKALPMLPLINVLVCCLFSMLMVEFLLKPIDTYRQKRIAT